MSTHHRVENIAVIGNYLPRQCGIATFTTDLVTNINENIQGVNCFAVAMNDVTEGYDYPPEVRFEINQNEIREYIVASEFLNVSGVDVVCLQHEYGIFGGDYGNYIVQLIKRLSIPVVTTLHTILQNPTPGQKRVLTDIINYSSQVVVMSEMAIKFLTEIYGVPKEKISLIHHGIPDIPFIDPNFFKDKFGVEGKRVLLTFGLLSKNKGIETVIKALPKVVMKHPDVVYIVLGATHPHVKKTEGESYRYSLIQLVKRLGLEEHVIFFDRFVELDELIEFLSCCDIYVIPYLSEAQIVSGTLIYAMGAGKAIISTPFWYAQEMLKDKRGILCQFGNSEEFADAIIRLLDDEIERNTIRKNAYQFSRNAVWSKVATDYVSLFNEVLERFYREPRAPFSLSSKKEVSLKLPDINLKHLITLTDDTGIIQHATYNIPNPAYGYCTDDNARALTAIVSLYELISQTDILDKLQTRYLSFLSYAFNSENGKFRNFMSYDRRWKEEIGSEDCQGRALWSLGTTCMLSKDPNKANFAVTLFNQALPHSIELTHPRAIALAMLGIKAYLMKFSGDTLAKRIFETLTDKLSNFFAKIDSDEWMWFEDIVTYENARIPHALLLAGEWFNRKDIINLALKILNWLISNQIKDGYFSPIGNKGFFVRGQEKARFDQQPIEAHAMIDACLVASKLTGEQNYYQVAQKAFNWFLGENDCSVVLYDDSTGGCQDGLTPHGANLNQGAESTLAWLHSLISMNAYLTGQDKLLLIKS